MPPMARTTREENKRRLRRVMGTMITSWGTIAATIHSSSAKTASAGERGRTVCMPR